MRNLGIVLLVCLSVAACATRQQTAGTAAGAVGGAVVGGPVGAVVGGAAGAVVTAPR
jgi:osmotically inducible lipoprotein OsmB